MNNSTDNNANKELVEIANEWGKAIVANDAGAIGRFMDDDWVIVSPTGVSDKRQFLSFVESGDLTHDAMDMIDGTARVRIYENVAVLTGRVTNTAHYKGEEFLADEWTTDVFVKRNGEWKCVLSHITPRDKTTPE